MGFHVQKDSSNQTRGVHPKPLVENHNESDTWLDHIEQNFVRKRNKTSSV